MFEYKMIKLWFFMLLYWFLFVIVFWVYWYDKVVFKYVDIDNYIIKYYWNFLFSYGDG